MFRRDFISGLVVLAGSVWSMPVLADPKDLVVIVHPDSPIRSVTADELHAIFTTRMRNWGDGTKLVPLNFAPRESHRVAFDRAVLGMTPDEVGRYWIDRKVRGGNPPPKQVPNIKLMNGVVAKLRQAIGYVPSSERGERVRIVARVRDGSLVDP